METMRWTNPHNPQTLQIANFLLYLNAFWLVLGIFSAGGALVFLIGSVFVAIHVYGGWGIANRKKAGYAAAVAAAFSPAILRFFYGFSDPATSLISAILEMPGLHLLRGQGIFSYMFELALIGLLLHPESRNYQKLWFD